MFMPMTVCTQKPIIGIQVALGEELFIAVQRLLGPQQCLICLLEYRVGRQAWYLHMNRVIVHTDEYRVGRQVWYLHMICAVAHTDART